ncbi:PREDICTED: protein lethal(2)essential for life-like [Wasmannia auropunctata]|uniref:protein lethal(2)essential for life-like n=1 Tax=Wasmannia auropunctata TaxID=64793 RepID=UPI0005F042E3|nr:PREDICTED: protein lethal(2)essential for life-like [Wasmannia auropunctata]
MALQPFIFCDLEDSEECRFFLDPNYGLVRRLKRLPSPAEAVNDYLMSWRNHDQLKNMLNLATRHYESPRTSPTGKDNFQVVLDVQHFKPEEIEVKIVDNHLVITAKHEDTEDDHGWVSRQFVRKYQLPKDINVEHLTSKLSSDGLLTIVAPKLQPLKDETERKLQIEYTGKPFLNKKQEKPQAHQQSEEEKNEKPTL